MNFFSNKEIFKKNLILFLVLFFNFSLQAKITMPTEGEDLDCGNEVVNSLNSDVGYSKARIEESLWTNTQGRIREITEYEKQNTAINAVGTLRCTRSNGETFSAAATVVVKGESDDAVIMFAGHSLCDESSQERDLFSKKDCVFQHEYRSTDKDRYGKVYAYNLNKISTKYKCIDNPDLLGDMAMATLENFDGAVASNVIVTDSVTLKRTVDDDGNIFYKSKDPRYDDAKMLLVGSDAIHKKLMVSENCGLFDQSEKAALYPDDYEQHTHDCKQTPGYSGGPVFRKQFDRKEQKMLYSVVCINSGTTAHRDYSSKYGLFIKGFTGGRCNTITKKNFQNLYKSVRALE